MLRQRNSVRTAVSDQSGQKTDAVSLELWGHAWVWFAIAGPNSSWYWKPYALQLYAGGVDVGLFAHMYTTLGVFGMPAGPTVMLMRPTSCLSSVLSLSPRLGGLMLWNTVMLSPLLVISETMIMLTGMPLRQLNMGKDGKYFQLR